MILWNTYLFLTPSDPNMIRLIHMEQQNQGIRPKFWVFFPETECQPQTWSWPIGWFVYLEDGLGALRKKWSRSTNRRNPRDVVYIVSYRWKATTGNCCYFTKKADYDMMEVMKTLLNKLLLYSKQTDDNMKEIVKTLLNKLLLFGEQVTQSHTA